ncbi:hypothetical protein [Streptomyces akebiae]|uniref:Uncharacterized protein n=1 Tax=Streptomyces akebiae TaxID=2865673 RepID=A0ABX8Y4H0_9ACTN|nr:hypothetical protein [Streptomyces akebiae]QYX82653.1 hypothetical protein K1J60_44375 [Streptomyces akebiae]
MYCRQASVVAAQQPLAVRSHLLQQLDRLMGAPRQLVGDRERLLGGDHPDTLTAREALSSWRSGAA